jgi:hypothetical protein
MRTDAGRRWGSDDKLEGFVRDHLVQYARFFQNHVGDYLPRMSATIPGQFNASGHGIDIMALDDDRRLWIIEVSRGSIRGAGSVKLLGTRKDGNAQMSRAWRTLKKDKFLELPDAQEKLTALFDVPGMPKKDLLTLFDAKLDKHKVAIVVPEGCHVEGARTRISFGFAIYTFPVSPKIELHSRKR